MKIGIFVLNPNFTTQKGISKNLQPLRKGRYQIIEKPTDVTYKLIDTNKKEIIQQRNYLLPYYPKEHALREITQLYSFTGLKIVQNNSETKLNHHTDEQTSSKTDQQKKINNQTSPKQKTRTSQKERKNRKMTERILPQDQEEKSEHRESSRLRSQPQKNYKIFIPQSKILKKVEFKK